MQDLSKKNINKAEFENLFKIIITSQDFENCHIILFNHDEYVNFVLFKILIEPYLDLNLKYKNLI